MLFVSVWSIHNTVQGTTYAWLSCLYGFVGNNALTPTLRVVPRLLLLLLRGVLYTVCVSLVGEVNIFFVVGIALIMTLCGGLSQRPSCLPSRALYMHVEIVLGCAL